MPVESWGPRSCSYKEEPYPDWKQKYVMPVPDSI